MNIIGCLLHKLMISRIEIMSRILLTVIWIGEKIDLNLFPKFVASQNLNDSINLQFDYF